MRARILSQRFISSISATLSTDLLHEPTVQKASWSAVSGCKSRPHDDSSRFSTGFSTGVENFGERPKTHGITAGGTVPRRTPTLAHFTPIDTLGSRSLTLTVRFHSEGES